MFGVTMEMEQFDCPFIDTTADHDVSFSATHWQLDTAARKLDTRMFVRAEDRHELSDGLAALREHENLDDYKLHTTEGDESVIHTTIEETHAMSTIMDHGGYITGPFRISEGSETWQVGFDEADAVDDALYDLEKGNEFVVESRQQVSPSDLIDTVRNADAAAELLGACRDLTTVERETIETAAAAGYFESPRAATLSTLADEFDVSTAAVSKNMRRGEKKLLRSVVEALEQIE